MKNKSLVIILSVLAFIVLIVILSSTIFCLKTVDISFYSNTINLTNKQTEIIESGEFKFNQSIFFINKQKYIDKLEQNTPYLKVLNLETNFPNQITINAVERNELFCIKGYNENIFNSYMILDSELKVLKNEHSFTNSHTNSILITFDNEQIEKKAEGNFITCNYNQLLKNIATELLCYNDNYQLLKANFEEITINFESSNDIKIKMRSGVNIVLKDVNVRISEKFMLALSTYDDLDDKTSGNITTYVNNDGVVVGYIS